MEWGIGAELSRHRVPGAPIQEAPCTFLVETTPLLKEEGDSRRTALSANGAYPSRIHGPGTCATFSADYHPMNAGDRQFFQRCEERLAGKKPDRCLDTL